MTVIANVFCPPSHITRLLVYSGVTVMVAVIGVIPVLWAVKAGMFPEPLAPSPIDGVLFNQPYDVPVPMKLTGFVVDPSQRI